MKTLNRIAQHYDNQALRFERDIRACNYLCERSFRQRQQTVLKLLGEITGKTILDVGCGPGLFTAPLSSSNALVGLDLSLEMLRFARTSVNPIQGDGERLPFKDESFDIVLAIEALQHVKYPRLFLKELVRVTKSGGQLVVSTLNRHSFLHWAFKRFGRYEGLRFHSLQDICQTLREEAFAHQETNFLGFPFPIVWKSDRINRFLSLFSTSWILLFVKGS
jgi:ubiquinone/menaquinone biosynthesis C-methylase UbiE